MTRVRRLLPALVAATVVLLSASAAQASMLIGRNASHIRLALGGNGQSAMVSFQAGGRSRHVLVWGAVDAKAAFRIDYSGGWGSHRANWRAFGRRCLPYTGPALPLLVTACDAPDGSYWAVQQWERLWPNYGGRGAPRELHVSHWRGSTGVLRIWTDWSYQGKYRHLYGDYRYHDAPIFGLHWTSKGVTLDPQGRTIFVDYLDNGVWRRENSFLTHPTTGAFCYSFMRHAGRFGNGSAYRATAIGDGVSPIVRLEFAPPGAYSAPDDAQANAAQQALLGNDSRCVIN